MKRAMQAGAGVVGCAAAVGGMTATTGGLLFLAVVVAAVVAVFELEAQP